MAAAAAARILKIGDVPRFMNDGSISWPAHLLRVSQQFAAGQVPAELRVTYLISAFEGLAQTVIISAFGEDGVPLDTEWEAALEQLGPLFHPAEPSHHRERRFAALQLQNFPSVAAAVAAFHAAVAVNPTGLDDAGKKAKLIAMCSSFPLIVLELERTIEDDAVTFPGFIAHLQRLTPLYSPGTAVGVPPGGSNASPVAAVNVDGSAAAMLEKLQTTIAAMMDQRGRQGTRLKRKPGPQAGAGSGTPTSSAGRKFSGKCFSCGEVGHMAREYRSKESSYIAGSVSRAGRRRTRSTVVNTDTGIRVGSAVSGSLAGSMRMTATLQGPQGSIAATVLFDTGANANVVAQRWVHQSGLTSLMTNATSAVQFVFANGERAWSTKELPSAVLQLGEFNERIALRVAPKMLDDVDIILGLPWFRRRNP